MTEPKVPEAPKVHEEIQSLCLAGAFNRGICYLGSLKKLEEESLLNLKNIVSVSIGSLIATGIVIGYKPIEMYKLIVEKDTREFMDISLLKGKGGVLKGESYRKWVYNTLQQKLLMNNWISDIDEIFTLNDLYKKTNIELTIATTCIHSNNDNFKEGLIFLNHVDYPDVPVTTSVIASMSFPFIFPPLEYDSALFIDGGVLNNFPIEKIDKNGLGICPITKPLNGLESVKNPISYINKIFELLSNHSDSLKNLEYTNVLKIDCEHFDTVDFDMTIDDKVTLYKLGYCAMEKYLKNHKKDRTIV